MDQRFDNNQVFIKLHLILVSLCGLSIREELSLVSFFEPEPFQKTLLIVLEV